MSVPPPAHKISDSQPHNHYFSRQNPGDPVEYSRSVTRINAVGIELDMATGEGVFSKNKLDSGSRLLLESALRSNQLFDFGANGHLTVCDLGCGWGAIGCFIARSAPNTRVVMCDVNARAARLARLNAARNQMSNTSVFCGDGLDAVQSEYFDAVFCNPPIRAGNAVIQKLFDDAQRCLAPGGVLCVVIRTAQGAKSWQKKLNRQFGNCETLALESGYRILKCEKSTADSMNGTDFDTSRDA